MKFHFENTFSNLPKEFYTRLNAEAFSKKPVLVHANKDAATLIDLDPTCFNSSEFIDYFSGNKIIPGSDPLASVYAGHQFGYFVPQLGDGRALLLGQIRNEKGELWDVQLKGAGRTPYSRFGDGRAVLRSTIREYLCSEAMRALNIPTTRALAIIGTNEDVVREEIEPGAILTRLAPSHIRFGHFEFFYHSDQHDKVRELADYVIDEFFSHFQDGNRYLQWFGEVVERTARLIARWQAAGFAHGVMNTDNMSILGLTIDYGPFGFMEGFNPRFICNHSDETGRYAFDQQPGIGQWNLYALAYALQPLFSMDEAKDIISSYGQIFREEYSALMAAKLGLGDYQGSDAEMIQNLLKLLDGSKADYTNSFRYLAEGKYETWLGQFEDEDAAKNWLHLWQSRADNKKIMKSANPKFILRNWTAEIVIRAAQDIQDYSTLDDIFKIITSPYDDHAGYEHFTSQAPEKLKDLCISCSS